MINIKSYIQEKLLNQVGRLKNKVENQLNLVTNKHNY